MVPKSLLTSELELDAPAALKPCVRLDLSAGAAAFFRRTPAHYHAASAEGWTLVGPGAASAVVPFDVELDVTRQRLPYADASVAMIYAAHTLESVTVERLVPVLREWRRVLRPGAPVTSADHSTLFDGGILRLVVRDVAAAAQAFAEREEAFFERCDAGGLSGPGSGVGGGGGVGVAEGEVARPLGLRFSHWLRAGGAVSWFDHESMAHYLRAAGFDGMYRSARRKSLMPQLRGEAFDQDADGVVYIEAWHTT